jgi:hypothetical protein
MMDRKTIPKPLKTLVWNKYIGEEYGIGKCDVCGSELKVSNFDCGHIISVKEGGEDIIHNLAPICRSCNLSMGTENLNEFKERYFSNKSHIDIYVKHLLVETFETVIRKGFAGYKEYEYPHFVSANAIYIDYRKWLYYNHTRYYEQMGFTSWIRSPEKKELLGQCTDTFGDLVIDPMGSSEWGFINLKFK